MSIDELKKTEARARRAEELLNNETLKEAFREIRESVFKEFEQTPIDDDGARLILRLKLQIMDDIRKYLGRRVNLGHKAVVELNALSKQDRDNVRKARGRHSHPWNGD